MVIWLYVYVWLCLCVYVSVIIGSYGNEDIDIDWQWLIDLCIRLCWQRMITLMTIACACCWPREISFFYFLMFLSFFSFFDNLWIGTQNIWCECYRPFKATGCTHKHTNAQRQTYIQTHNQTHFLNLTQSTLFSNTHLNLFLHNHHITDDAHARVVCFGHITHTCECQLSAVNNASEFFVATH